MSVWELPPGQAAYPYHWHVAEEELLIVLAGRPSLRTPEGWRELAEGDVVSFPTGERGAHQVVNRTQDKVRFMAVSNQQPDIVMYPDSGKLGAYERRPEGGGPYRIFRLQDGVDYYEGEDPPSEADADAFALVRRVYDDWSRGDFASAAGVFHPDVLFVRHAPESLGDAASVSGRWRGREEMALATREWLSAWDEFSIREEELREHEGRVLALTRWGGRGRDSGVPMDRVGADLWTVRQGHVVELQMWWERDDGLAKLGLAP